MFTVLSLLQNEDKWLRKLRDIYDFWSDHLYACIKTSATNTLSESSVLSLLTSHACSLTSPENYL